MSAQLQGKTITAILELKQIQGTTIKVTTELTCTRQHYSGDNKVNKGTRQNYNGNGANALPGKTMTVITELTSDSQKYNDGSNGLACRARKMNSLQLIISKINTSYQYKIADRVTQSFVLVVVLLDK